jgi:hypothetical protein
MWVMTQLVRQFKDLSPARRFWVPGVIAAAVALVAAAEVDIQRRPAGEVRGSKLLWRVLSLNALGSASYFRWGRRTTQQ